jgi:hypothetical protein
MFPKPIEVLALEKYQIWIKFSDTTEGIIDLSHLAQQGVFKEWEEPGVFNLVHIHPETDAIAWNDNIEICPDSLYLQLLGMSFEEWEQSKLAHATD